MLASFGDFIGWALDLFVWAFDLLVHLDQHLNAAIASYGALVYAILFIIVFCETGLVVTPFLPGDSLLFAAGTIAAQGSLDVVTLFAILIAAPFFGDNANYWMGRSIGPRVFRGEKVRFLNRRHLDRTRAFYERHGAKTVIIARFVPIVRTFAPFVAGIGRMAYWRFMAFSILGSLAWVTAFVLGGYFFGNIPVVKANFTAVIFAIILVSISPGIIAYLKGRIRAAAI